MAAAASMGDDEPPVEVTFMLSRTEHSELERLADVLGVDPGTVLREALAMRLVMRDMLADGGTIHYRLADGTTGELDWF
jgi:hypothetical protein